MDNWWLTHFKPDPDKILKPKRRIDIKDVFVTYHYVTLTELEVDKLRVPQAYAMGNALWLSLLYFNRGGTIADRLNGVTNKPDRLLAGLRWKPIVRPQIRGEVWLKRLQIPGEVVKDLTFNTLCGPDEFYSRVILPIGVDFFYGTMVPEMKLLFKKYPKGMKRLARVSDHDFNKCALMTELREKDRKRYVELHKEFKKKSKKLQVKSKKKKRKRKVAK